MKKVPCALTIAGSDSGGGAGIQADLKTFAALHVHGMSALTSITAQNTTAVTAVQDVQSDIVKAQIDAVVEDIGVDAAKTGMLHTIEIIEAVAEKLEEHRFPTVVDPVMIAKSGAPLLKPEAMDALKTQLLPKAIVITPNKFEAEKLTGRSIGNLEAAKLAAKELSEMGPKAVVVKGGHLTLAEAVDILYYSGEYKIFKTPRLDVKTTHGTGCSFSAAITAQLAKGDEIPSAVEHAKNFVTSAIRFGVDIGKGFGPVNPLATLYREASRYQILKKVDEARQILEASPDVAKLVPEVGMNIAMATPYAESIDDVAAIDGRIVKTRRGVKAAGNPKFGCSSHLAKYIIEIVKHDARKMAAINLKFSDEILSVLEKWGMMISLYDRENEPEEIKKVEGMSVPWGVKEAIKKVGKVPDVIYHKGDIGKEPMIVVLGEQAYDLAQLAVKLAGEKFLVM